MNTPAPRPVTGITITRDHRPSDRLSIDIERTLPMNTTDHADPTRTMTPAQRQELKAASAEPIGTARDATREVARLADLASQIDARIRKAAQDYARDTNLPESVPDDARAQVRRDAETRIADVEGVSRRELAIAKARARSIVGQLEEAAAEPNLNAVPSDVLDGANRYLPLVQSQVQGASLPDIAKRLQAAVVRDDPSELLALGMVIGPILAERHANPDGDDDALILYDLKGRIRQITGRWRDRSLDAALDRARATAARLDSLDQAILDGYQERTGETDIYGFLGGMR
jgi:hypothetical protein